MFNYYNSIDGLKEFKKTDFYKEKLTNVCATSINDGLRALETLKDIDELLETENSACGRFVKDIIKEHGF